MSKITYIFVEGDADVKFISDYISHIISGLEVKIQEVKIQEVKKRIANIFKDSEKIAVVHGLNGWTDIKNMKTDISRYKDEGDNVLVIFDADTPKNEGGFVDRKKEIEGYSLRLDGIFLFPDNKTDGALEDLLEKIINETNKPIFDCWEKYETCLKECASKKIEKELTTPAKKSKIYGYLEALIGETKEKKKIKDPFRDYKNTEHWNLDSDSLNPLKKFLLQHIN
jgi:exosome complex RNA-binding protein Rrp4